MDFKSLFGFLVEYNLYFSHGTTKYNANNVLYLSGHTSFPHDIHESLVVACSLMRVLLYGYHYSRLHSRVGSQEPLIKMIDANRFANSLTRVALHCHSLVKFAHQEAVLRPRRKRLDKR